MNTQPNAPVEPRKVDAGRGWSWIAEAFEMFKQAPGTWIGIFIVYLVIMVAATAVPGASLLLNLFNPVFSAGMILACSSQAAGKGVKIDHLFAAFKGGQMGQLVLLALLYMVALIAIMLVGVLIALIGFGLSPTHLASSGVPDQYILPLLLVFLILVALFIPVAMGMWLAPALIALRGLGPVDAFKLSFRACLINFVPLLLYGIFGLLIAIVATIPLALGWLVAAPVFIISVYAAYRDMFPPPPPDFNATQPIPVPPPL